MSAQTNEISVISSNEFSYDPAYRILTARAAELSPSFELFNILDEQGNRGFILEWNGDDVTFFIDEVLPDCAGWIYYPAHGDEQVAVFIDNT